MPTLTVPKEYASGLSRIVDLSPEESKRIANALQKAKTSNLRELTELVALAVPELPIREAREIVETLRSLYGARTSMDVTVDVFVKEVLKAALQNSIKVGLDEPQRAEAASHVLHELLTVRPLSMISKARGLHIDHENIFCSVRIISDLRPVFDTDIEADPTGFVMAHIMKLGYHHNGKHTELYIAMDKVDVNNLLDALQRAQKKAATLAQMGQSKGFQILAD